MLRSFCDDVSDGRSGPAHLQDASNCQANDDESADEHTDCGQSTFAGETGPKGQPPDPNLGPTTSDPNVRATATVSPAAIPREIGLSPWISFTSNLQSRSPGSFANARCAPLRRCSISSPASKNTIRTSTQSSGLMSGATRERAKAVGMVFCGRDRPGRRSSRSSAATWAVSPRRAICEQVGSAPGALRKQASRNLGNHEGEAPVSKLAERQRAAGASLGK